MKLLKRWSFLWILLASGTVLLTATGSWDEVGKPLLEARAWFGEEPVQGGDEEPETNPDVSHSDADSQGSILSGGNVEGVVSGNGAGSGGDGETVPADGNGTGSGEAGNGNSSVENSADPDSGGTQEMPVTSRSPEEVTYTTVEDDYFSDAVFIGDSRTVGMFEYGGLENITTFYASTGLTVFKLFDSPIVTVPGQKEKITVEQALSERQFSKIYLMIGINEMGRGTVETFMEKYKEVLAHLQELQPEAVIYLQAIMRVTTERSNKGDYINNAGIDARNAEIAKLADYVQVYYLDVNPLICDETGGMEPSYTFDGVHLKAQYIPIWKDFLKQHAVVLD